MDESFGVGLMGITGPKPTDPSKRLRANAPTFPTVELNQDDAPKKARALPGASKFTAATRRRWRMWATSPQASQFLETDWGELEDLARLLDAFHRGDLSVASEMRLRAAKLGATIEDRLRLRMRMVEGKAADERDQKNRRSRRPDPRLEVLKGGAPDA